MCPVISISGEISLLFEAVDSQGRDVLLITIDPDEVLAFNTFEVHGDIAARLAGGALQEGLRIRVDCRSETIEMIDPGTGDTFDEERPEVLDVVVLD